MKLDSAAPLVRVLNFFFYLFCIVIIFYQMHLFFILTLQVVIKFSTTLVSIDIMKACRVFNCNYILFTKLPWPGDSEGTFCSSSQAGTCPPVNCTRWGFHTVALIAERQSGKL